MNKHLKEIDKKQIQLIDSLTPSTTMESLFFHIL